MENICEPLGQWVHQKSKRLLIKSMQHCIRCKKGTAPQHENIPSRGDIGWRKHHDLELLCCLLAWTSCHQERKYLFQRLQWNPAGQCQWLSTAWSSVEAGWCSRRMTINIKVNYYRMTSNRRSSQSPNLKPIHILWNGFREPFTLLDDEDMP